MTPPRPRPVLQPPHCSQVVREERIEHGDTLVRRICAHGWSWHVVVIPSRAHEDERPIQAARYGSLRKRQEGEARIKKALALVQENGMPKALPWRRSQE